MNRIFISLAAFVDPLLFFAVCRAIHRAKYPERLRLGIVEQGLHDNTALYTSDSRIRYEFIRAEESEGVCWARAKVQGLYDGEELYLQIDSHTDFEQDWDELLENTLIDLESRYDRPLISTYPPNFSIDAEGAIHRDSINTEYALSMVPKKEAAMSADNPVFMFIGVWAKVEHPTLGFHVAGGFIFSRGNFVTEVPYDPQLYFHGEEQNLALRAFTHGWNIFHPIYIPLWHKYKMAGEEHINHHWHQSWEKKRTVKWPERQKKAKDRLNDLLADRIPRGDKYGLGELRDIQMFADFCGIDYLKRVINRQTHSWLPSPE